MAAAADFNRDGVSDLVGQNDSTRQVTVNYYGGSGTATTQGAKRLPAHGSGTHKCPMRQD